MRTTTRFEPQGTLRKPGLMGRIIRFGFGLGSLYFVAALLLEGEALIGSTLPTDSGWWLALGLGVYVFPHVVNIGFTRRWGRWPQAIVLGLLVGIIGLNLIIQGTYWSPTLGWFVRIWLLYVFGHLGLSFILSSFLATPGCEMRAVPHLWSLLIGHSTAEHYCPGPLDGIDAWERKRGQQGA